jgi:hypothetical protein
MGEHISKNWHATECHRGNCYPMGKLNSYPSGRYSCTCFAMLDSVTNLSLPKDKSRREYSSIVIRHRIDASSPDRSASKCPVFALWPFREYSGRICQICHHLRASSSLPQDLWNPVPALSHLLTCETLSLEQVLSGRTFRIRTNLPSR